MLYCTLKLPFSKTATILRCVLCASHQPKHVHLQAWRYLGVAQSKNEQESLAIAALQRSVELNKHDVDALFALGEHAHTQIILTILTGGAYTNEYMYNDVTVAMVECT